jgi:hypothetical protein
MGLIGGGATAKLVQVRLSGEPLPAKPQTADCRLLTADY